MSELKRAILAAMETEYGTAVVPLAASAVEAFEINANPLAGQTQTKRVAGGMAGARRVFRVGEHQTLQVGVPLAGADAAGAAPRWGLLARMCGLGQAVVADTSVTYEPVSDGYESGTVYYHQDAVLHRLLGVRGTSSINIPAKDEPFVRFELTGLYTAVTAGTLPTVSFAGVPNALVPSSETVSVCTLFDETVIMESFVGNFGHQVTARHRVNHEAVTIDDTVSTATIVIEEPAITAFDWWSLPQSREMGTFALSHGLAAGNTVSIAAPKVQIVNVVRRFDASRPLLELT